MVSKKVIVLRPFHVEMLSVSPVESHAYGTYMQVVLGQAKWGYCRYQILKVFDYALFLLSLRSKRIGGPAAQ